MPAERVVSENSIDVCALPGWLKSAALLFILAASSHIRLPKSSASAIAQCPDMFKGCLRVMLAMALALALFASSQAHTVTVVSAGCWKLTSFAGATSDGRSHMSVFSEVPGTYGSTVGCLAALLLWWMQHRSSAVADSRTSFEGAGVHRLGLAFEGAGVTVLAHRCCITFWHCA